MCSKKREQSSPTDLDNSYLCTIFLGSHDSTVPYLSRFVIVPPYVNGTLAVKNAIQH